MPPFQPNRNIGLALNQNIAQRLASLPAQMGAMFQTHLQRQMDQIQRMNQPEEQPIEQSASLGNEPKKPEQDQLFQMLQKHGMAGGQ